MVHDIYDILDYPHEGTRTELVTQLDELGVTLMPKGKKNIFGIPVLGKGWSSLVVYGIYAEKEVAVKIQRRDSHRISLSREASFLRIVNAHGIGPTLYHEGLSFLLLEYIQGDIIHEASMNRTHVLSFFNQCHQLDRLSIDHGQIQGGKHLIIGEKCWIIDFEKAGWRKPRNVTSLGSELFLKKTDFARTIRELFGVDHHTLLTAFNQYKRDYNIDRILHKLCG
jgi:putative serine/threonine protein kinase